MKFTLNLGRPKDKPRNRASFSALESVQEDKLITALSISSLCL